MTILDESISYHLLQGNQQKPIDLGDHGFSASLLPNGRFVTLNAYHSKYGNMIVAPFEQFPHEKHYDTPFVRQYRARPLELMDEADGGFGLLLHGATNSKWSYLDAAWPVCNSSIGSITVETTYLMENGICTSLTRLQSTSSTPSKVEYSFGGKMRLNRASYSCLTEIGPCDMPQAESIASIKGNVLTISNSFLPAKYEMSLTVNNLPVELSADIDNVVASGTITVNPGIETVVTASYRLYEQNDVLEKPPVSRQGWKSSLPTKIEYIVRRNLEYILANCSLHTASNSVCIITDHQVLPLGWTRDNYYQIALVQEVYRRVDDLVAAPYRDQWRDRMHEVLSKHLVWVFQASRPQGYWGRSYLAHGQILHDVFQLDQQCYPLLELAEFYEAFGDENGLVSKLAKHVDGVLDTIMQYKDENHWLFQTQETPGDDEVVFPYHFSSHVLLYHTLQKLAHMQESISGIQTPVARWAADVKADTLKEFTTTLNGKPIYAYLASLKGDYQFYHDANDIPSAYAPLWGFCSAKDQAWLNLFAFGLSSENQEGYYPGRYGGLGSVHTRNAWPLGDSQQLIFAILTNNEELKKHTVERLLETVQWDGLYAEAVDQDSGKVTSKHWFSWPGSMISRAFLSL